MGGQSATATEALPTSGGTLVENPCLKDFIAFAKLPPILLCI